MLVYIQNELFPCMTIPLKFIFKIVGVEHNSIHIRNKEKCTVFKLDVDKIQDFKIAHIGRDVESGMVMYDKYICCWKPLEGTLLICDYQSNHCFPIYYGCLGKCNIRSSDGKKTRFTKMISSRDGLIVKIEKSKYILVEF